MAEFRYIATHWTDRNEDLLLFIRLVDSSAVQVWTWAGAAGWLNSGGPAHPVEVGRWR